jgi:hypothetical protein
MTVSRRKDSAGDEPGFSRRDPVWVHPGFVDQIEPIQRLTKEPQCIQILLDIGGMQLSFV